MRTALQGASIVVYPGHGNGFPSPGRTSPYPASQSGLGLNAVAGQAEPTLAVVRARIDSYAAGFLRAGARAVIADAHFDTDWHVGQLFTTPLGPPGGLANGPAGVTIHLPPT